MPGSVNALNLSEDYECKVGHSDPIPVEFELDISRNLRVYIPTAKL